MRVLGLIPARGGSKGIPGKNKKLLGGKPLLQYTIDQALQSKHLTDVVFSSEDASLIALAKSLGAQAPFVRPLELATDTAGSLEVVQHALQEMELLGKTYDAVCLLQVTTPFRGIDLIDTAIAKFKNAEADSLVTVQSVPQHYNPHWVFKTHGDLLQLATGEKNIIKRRQDLPPAFIRDGAIYITKTTVLLNDHSFFGNRISYLQSDAATYVNIDTENDWQKAEQIINSGLV